MTPVVQPGSRGGLIAAMITFAVLWVATLGGGIYVYSKWDKAQLDLANRTKLIDDLVTDDAKGHEMINTVQLPESSGQSAFDAMNTRMRNLVVAVTGDSSLTDKEKVSNPQIYKIADELPKKLNDTLAAASLRVTTAGLPPQSYRGFFQPIDAYSQLIAQQRADDLKALNNEKIIADGYANDIKALNTQIATLTGSLKDANSRVDTVTQTVAAEHTSNQSSLEDAKKNMEQVVNQTEAQLATAEDQLNQYKTQLDASNNRISDLTRRLAVKRLDPSKAAMFDFDGLIVRTSASSNTCYINLGFGDQVSPGMTFEVYDAGDKGREELAAGSDPNSLPAGIASIEVIKIGQNESECRIIANTDAVAANMQVANLIFNKNAKFQFYIYPGDGFDLNRDGRVNPFDTEVLKRLITRWGGGVTPTLDVFTDFVVMGEEPEIPEVKMVNGVPDLQSQANHDRAKERQTEYFKVRDRAVDLHIPVLNQNRFLYYIGYFEEAARGE